MLRLAMPLLASLVLAGCPWPFQPELALRQEVFVPAQAGGLQISLSVEGDDRERLALLRISVSGADGQPLSRRNLSEDAAASGRVETLMDALPAGPVVMAVEAFDVGGDRLALSKRDLVVTAGALTPVQVRLLVDERAESGSPGSGAPEADPTSLPQNASGGPMVFGPRTRYTYQVHALHGVVPLGLLELRVVRFEPRAAAIRLGIETSQVIAGIREARTWDVDVDADWIYADGKPFLPQRATPGFGWTAVDGHAGLVRLEPVETPLGTFPGCWRVAYFQGNGEPATFWFAPGKGLVKAEFTHGISRLVATVSRIEP